MDSVEEGEGGIFWENSIKTCILSRVKQITSPGGMHETSAQAWCTGKTQRNRVEREVGGGLEWGIHVKPWLILVIVLQKPLQCCKVISLQLIKINGGKKKKKLLWNSCSLGITCSLLLNLFHWFCVPSFSQPLKIGPCHSSVPGVYLSSMYYLP